MATLAKLSVSIGANTAEFEQNLKKVQSQLKGFQKDTAALDPIFNAIGTAIKTVGVAMIGAFVGAGTMALNSAAKLETYRLSLTSLMGSSKAAGEAVASALALASKTPFTDDQLLAASVALTKFGQDAKTVLPQVANMASATNGDVGQAAEAYGRFLLGQTKALSAYGINKAMVLKEGAAMETGVQIANQKGQIVNEAAFETALLSLIDKRSKDGAALRANSIAGLKKSLLDVADDALRTMAGVTDQGDIMAGGLADTFKKAVAIVIAKIEEWKANGSLQEWADNVGKAITTFFTNAKKVFDWLVGVAVVIARNWDTITPVIWGVIGAFVAFKGVATYVDIAAAAIKAFGSASAIAALGPIALIIGAVATLAAGVAYLIEKLNQEKALLNSMNAAGMAEYDAVTQRTGTSMTDAGQDPTAYYASRVAGHQKYVNAIKQQSDDAAKVALASRNATSKAYAREKADEYAKTVTDNATTGKAITTTAITTAGAVTKANTGAADAIAKTNADLANKNYDLTHTELQNKLHAIDLEAAADLKAGANAKAVAQWVANSKAQINKEAATTQAAADKEAQDKYLASVKDYVSKQKDVVTALTQTIIDQYQIRENAAIKELERERDARLAAINTQISDLTGQHDQAAQADKMAGLAANFANATTEEARAAASKTLMDAVNEEAYQNQLASLQKEQETVADKYNNPTTGKIAAATTYYDNLKLLRNADAEAEKALAGTTQTDIVAMLQNRLSEWKGLGTQIGDSLYSGLQSTLGAFASLGATANPITVASNASNASNVSAGLQSALFGGGSGRSLMAHANGGYFTTPHVGLIAEKGPEFVIPQSQASSFAQQMGGSDMAVMAAQQRQMMLKMDTIISKIGQVAPGVGSVINGLGRA